MKQKVRKVVIPAAGFGTRFLPQTKAIPKEMLPIVDKPVIQFIVEEAVEAGIRQVVIVTNGHKRPIEDHFDHSFELEKRFEEFGKTHLIPELQRIAQLADFTYVRQKGSYGTAKAVESARHLIDDEPFLVLWGDDFFLAEPSRVRQMLKAYEKYQTPIVCGMKVREPGDYRRYGFIRGPMVEQGVWQIKEFVEKPGPENPPSDIAVVSAYLLTPDIFPLIEKVQMNKGEYYLTDAIDQLAKMKPVYALEMQNARYYDTGNKLDYLKTIVELALQHPEVGEQFKEYLVNFVAARR